MNHNQILVMYIAEECTILWAKFGVITVFHCSVIIRMVTFGGGNITECSYRGVSNDIEGRL